MACNGWNHPPDCNCDFSGGYKGGAYGGGGYFFVDRAKVDPFDPVKSGAIWGREESYCSPTNCPRCGAEVFFIRHNGGSVWVDSLGAPWPKHGCFDNEAKQPSQSRWLGYFRDHAAGSLGSDIDGRQEIGIIVHAFRAEAEAEGERPTRLLLGVEFASKKICLATLATNTTSYLKGKLVIMERSTRTFYTSNCERRTIMDVEVAASELGLGDEWVPVKPRSVL